MPQRSFFKGRELQEPLRVAVRGCASSCLSIFTSITRDWLRLPTGHRFIPGKQTPIFRSERGIGSSQFLSRPDAAAKGLLGEAGLSRRFYAARCETGFLDYWFWSLVSHSYRGTSRGSSLRRSV